jgi:hypothetical protein
MITMEFEELQKIWDTQNSRPLYAIDEKALHNRILKKKKQFTHITNFSELLLIIVYAGAGIFVLGLNIYKAAPNIFMFLLAAWIFAITLYVLISRIRRIRRNKNRFQQSMYGDLDHTIAIATYQIRLSQFMRWNILPIGIFILLGIWNGGKSIWVAGSTLIFFALAYYAGGMEHRIYKARKRELQIFKENLEKEG